ncbi:DUF1801 domain-containing protein [Actinomadura sp. HBU206391]|uniref:DUF1801 domain-containing protein n=1 Tax=Actinomadura sp. HBU206391 TaxID=2731692 RepID=UPI00164F7793|nr:DUF1801 domain-containing protein [Actinomadura sp. HBU206391]MBC6459547.1 DUF1801 domain-containing protein [Actinomadura sp. HBU206391]
MNDEVTQYINKTQPWQIDVCEKLRAMVSQTIPEAEERLQYGKPHYLKNGHYAAVIAVAKDKVTFMVFNATNIPAVKGFLRALGNGERKAADIKEGQTVDYSALASILKETTTAL